MKNSVASASQPSSLHRSPDRSLGYSQWTLLFFVVALLLCIGVSIAPLNRLAGTTELLALPFNALLTWPGSWLPGDLHLTNDRIMSISSTNMLLFLGLVAGEFVLYGLGAWWLSSRIALRHSKQMFWWLVGATLLAGLLFIFTPAMISHDAYVYAGYGRTLAVYQANPYFVALTAFPHDPFIRLDDWKDAPSAYGPLWLLICTLSAYLCGEHAVLYVLFYRTLGLAAHLLNLLIIAHTLKLMGRSPRTILLGVWLYALNPLVLQESSLGGHNDTFLATCILAGIWLSVRIEQQGTFLRWRGYLAPLLAFTFALLIKFTAAPLIALFLLLLAIRSLQQDRKELSFTDLLRRSGMTTLRRLMLAGLVIGGSILLFYGPFWTGHSLAEILASFTSPPSANQAYGSILHAIIKQVNTYGLPQVGWQAELLTLFGSHKLWQNINTLTMVVLILVAAVWLWRTPTVRTMLLSALSMLGALLVITPWFFPWYVIWLICLVPFCLPLSQNRLDRALLVAALVFSASAHCIYLFAKGYPPAGTWIGWTAITTIGPPLLALVIGLWWPRTHQERASFEV
ncbi:hypothetical protein [Tengunoibacter tsumagoiensis]|uniref:Membrane protein n=1 Tax=Tengunoibacter tsumagoiensis TaxID=2014871 RepID=A0A402A1S7_9CHLR|nr:hypothetical protein [Tengunoibacter tsumagoiensis]GCE13016.1 membrane protein [Tengunoibacter tsumagoiensis]